MDAGSGDKMTQPALHRLRHTRATKAVGEALGICKISRLPSHSFHPRTPDPCTTFRQNQLRMISNSSFLVSFDQWWVAAGGPKCATTRQENSETRQQRDKNKSDKSQSTGLTTAPLPAYDNKQGLGTQAAPWAGWASPPPARPWRSSWGRSSVLAWCCWALP